MATGQYYLHCASDACSDELTAACKSGIPINKLYVAHMVLTWSLVRLFIDHKLVN